MTELNKHLSGHTDARAKPRGFTSNWLRGEVSRAARRRLMAVLRRAHAVLGLDRSRLALGGLGAGRIAVLLAAAGVAMAPAGGALAQYVAGHGIATAAGTIAISGTNGAPAQAQAKDSIAIGDGANTKELRAITIGANATTTGAHDSVAIGSGSIGGPINVGAYTLFGGTPAGTEFSSFGVGSPGQERQIQGVAPGVLSATSTDAVNGSQLYLAEVAIAAGATTKYFHANSTGTDSSAVGTDAVAIGVNSVATGAGSIAEGASAKANQASDVAIGNGATATGVAGVGSAVSIGAGNTAIGAGAVAIGDPSVANGKGAIAGGFNSIATSDGTAGGGAANGAVALGNAAIAAGQGSVALGNTSTVGAAGGIAVGDTASAKASKGVAVGSNSTANNANDVALGAGSVTAAANATASTTINGVVYNYAGTTPGSVVSVGAVGSERQVTNVAAGRVSGTSTDAVNGSQLFAADSAINAVGVIANKGFNLQANGGALSNVAPGGTVQFLNGSNILVTQSGNNVTVATVATPSFTGADFGSAKITHVADGTVAAGSLDGVNGEQLFATNTNVTNLGTQVTNLGGAVATDLGGGTTYIGGVLSAPTYVLAGVTYHDVGSALSAVSTVANEGFNVQANGGALGNVAPGGTVQFLNGSNILVTRSGNNLTVATVATPNFTGADFGSAKITHVADGMVAAGSLDGVNGEQLFATNTIITTLGNSVASGLGGGSSYNFTTGLLTTSLTLPNTGATTYNSVQGALNALSGSIVADVDAVQYTSGIGGATTTTPTNTATLVGAGGSTTTPVVLQNVAAGALNATSTQAVNGSQLFAVSTIANEGFNLQANGGALSNVAPGGTVQFLNGSNILVTRSGNNLTVATVATPNFTGADFGSAKITHVADGMVAAGSLDGVNGEQLFATNTIITTLGNSVASGLGGGSSYNFTTGLLTTSLTLPNTGATTYNSVQGALNALSGSIVADVDAVQYTSGIGGATTTTPTNTATLVGAGGSTTTPVVLQNVAAGALNATSTQAVNGSQLFATNTNVTNLGTQVTNLGSSVATDLGGGTTYVGGVLSAPTYVLGGVTYHDVGSALSAVSTVAGEGFNLQTNGGALSNVAPGGTVQFLNGSNILVTRSGNNLTVATVATPNFTGADFGGAKITNVADGTVAAGSLDGVNGEQLFAVKTVADNSVQYDSSAHTDVTFGGVGSTTPVTLHNVAAGVAGTDAVNVNQLDAATALAGSMWIIGNPTTYTAPSAAGVGATAAGSGASAAGAGATAVGDSSKAGGAGSTVIGSGATDNGVANSTAVGAGASVASGLTGTNTALGAGVTATRGAQTGYTAFGIAAPQTSAGQLAVGSAAAAVQVTGVAAGSAATDAVNVAQLQSALAGASANNVQYDDTTHTSVTLGGGNPTTGVALHNVAAGGLTATSLDAVNGSQLYAAEQLITSSTAPFRSDNSAAAAAPSASGANSTAGGYGAVASGVSSVALGNNASASSTNSVAVGYGAVSTGSNSVALGAGSSDGGAANVVSVGSPGHERTITNVAPGVNPTDAVNVSQLDGLLNGVGDAINRVRLQAQAGTALSLAASGLRYDSRPGTTSIAGAASGYANHAGIAFGLGHTSDNGNLRYNIAASFASPSDHADVGVVAGVSYTFGH